MLFRPGKPSRLGKIDGRKKGFRMVSAMLRRPAGPRRPRGDGLQYSVATHLARALNAEFALAISGVSLADQPG